MANYAEEAADLANLGGGALVLNMGTVTPDGIKNYIQALKAYNVAKRPVVFDPVGYEHSHPPPLLPHPGLNLVVFVAVQTSIYPRSLAAVQPAR